MTNYIDHGVNITKEQAKKISKAHSDGTGTVIRLSKNNLEGNFKLPLTTTQVKKIKTSKNGVQLNLSAAQLKYMERTGGFLPLIPLIAGIIAAAGGVGGLAGGVANVVNSTRSANELARHNRAIEDQLRSGSGVVSDLAGKIPVVGNSLKYLLKKIGLGVKDMKSINNGGCVTCNGIRMKTIGTGLYLEPQGAGVFLGPQRT